MTKIMWKPSSEQIKKTSMYRFMNFVSDKNNVKIEDYETLYRWSIENIPDFWAAMWGFAEIRASRKYERIIDGLDNMPGAKWFPGARLNFAENLLRYQDDRVALIFKGEATRELEITYSELYNSVARLAKSLKDYGIKPGDRVAGFIPNIPEAIISMLAGVSLGATWSSCSPDFGIKGVLDRFGQIQPRILFAADGYYYKGKQIDSLERISRIVRQIPSIEKVIVIPYINSQPDISSIPNAIHYHNFISQDSDLKIEFVQMPADHPLYIMYSSGTTGLPKCMVQSAGGILINQLKELLLHTDLKREDTIFYFTTCGWMMWNWLTCSLALGAQIVLYDGNPFYPDPGALWKMAQDKKITVFGTSAGYLAALQKTGAKPGKEYRLESLRTILSTGSSLLPEQFDFVYQDIKKNVQLSSISGGSDLNGCFAGGNPIAPVYRGELQCRCLGMKVEAYDEKGQSVTGKCGELVCTAPAPSMPIYFWDDPDGRKYRAAYFNVYPNVWCHGDFITITENKGIVFYGRSDATLNPGGVRIGTSEIYRQIETIDQIADSVVIGQNWENDVRVILFVVMKSGCKLTEELVAEIKKTIRTNASPRHVPSKIIEVKDIPYTLNMKKVELAVKNVVENRPVTNKDALSNSEALEYFKDIPMLQN